MKKITITILLIFNVCLFVKAQTKDSLSYYADKLNWESFGVIPNYATVTYRFDASALKIISALENDKRKSFELLKFIDRPEKTIAVHAILTKIYCPEKLQLALKSIFKIDANGKVLYGQAEGYEFTMNDVRWKLMFAKDNSRYSYIGPQIKTLRLHWKRKIKVSK